MYYLLALSILTALLCGALAARWLAHRPARARRSIFIITVAYLVLLGSGTLLLLSAYPAPLASAEYQGISIGDRQRPGGIVHISARRLACTEVSQPSPYNSSCTMQISGQRLTILARRTPPAEANKFSGDCRASFGDEAWPCRFGVSHHQKLFVFLDSGSSLTADQLQTLRLRFPIENLPETVFVALIIALPLLTAAVSVAFLLALLQSAWRPLRVSLAMALGTVAATASYFAAIKVSFNFID